MWGYITSQRCWVPGNSCQWLPRMCCSNPATWRPDKPPQTVTDPLTERWCLNVLQSVLAILKLSWSLCCRRTPWKLFCRENRGSCFTSAGVTTHWTHLGGAAPLVQILQVAFIELNVRSSLGEKTWKRAVFAVKRTVCSPRTSLSLPSPCSQSVSYTFVTFNPSFL